MRQVESQRSSRDGFPLALVQCSSLVFARACIFNACSSLVSYACIIGSSLVAQRRSRLRVLLCSRSWEQNIWLHSQGTQGLPQLPEASTER